MKFQVQHAPMRVFPLDERWFHGIRPIDRKHLLNSLRSLSKGRNPTPSFKLYGRSDVSLVDMFFEKIKHDGLDIPEWQLEYELSRKTKFGPQGGYAPWDEVSEDFELYYSRPTKVKAVMETELHKVYSKLQCSKMSLTTTLSALVADDKIRDRASGWRKFSLKKTDPAAQADALYCARHGLWENSFNYVFERFNKQKKRIFFPGSFSTMLLEAQYYFPFLKAIQSSLLVEKEKSPFTFWADKIGFDKMFDQIVTPICAPFDPTHFVYVQRDFEKMDTTTGFDQSDHSFIPKVSNALKLSPTERERFRDIIYFGSTCPIATPKGMYTGYRGKASGQTTTNGDETCDNEDYDANFKRKLEALCHSHKIIMKIVYSAGNGDDGMTIIYLKDLRRLPTLKKLIAIAADKAAEEYGFRVQGSKWHISNEYGLYCQRMIASRDGKIWNGYPATLILNSIINPEKEYNKSDWDKDYRDLDIIEKLDNGKNLQYFHQLVDFVDNGMKFRLLGRSEKETSRILSKYERYRALQDDPFNYQNIDIRGDISKSPTVQYLLNKRRVR